MPRPSVAVTSTACGEVPVAGPEASLTDTPATSPVGRREAVGWIASWDAQQQEFMPEREARFTALIDAVAEGTGHDEPLVIDLGCGPGSLSVRLLDRLPGATVIAVDADPLLLALGRAAWADRRGLRFAGLDLRDPGWAARLGLDRPADAVVSTTALHWLPRAALAALYAEVATVLRPGGLLLDGDHLREGENEAPTLARLGRALVECEVRRHPASGETWSGWWAAVRADPSLAGLVASRDELGLDAEHHGSPSGLLATHVEALQAAGFTEIGTLWQLGDNRLLCGVLGTAAAAPAR
jgi:SAM-dependent methyltransferase